MHTLPLLPFPPTLLLTRTFFPTLLTAHSVRASEAVWDSVAHHNLFSAPAPAGPPPQPRWHVAGSLQSLFLTLFLLSLATVPPPSLASSNPRLSQAAFQPTQVVPSQRAKSTPQFGVFQPCITPTRQEAREGGHGEAPPSPPTTGQLDRWTQ